MVVEVQIDELGRDTLEPIARGSACNRRRIPKAAAATAPLLNSAQAAVWIKLVEAAIAGGTPCHKALINLVMRKRTSSAHHTATLERCPCTQIASLPAMHMPHVLPHSADTPSMCHPNIFTIWMKLSCLWSEVLYA